MATPNKPHKPYVYQRADDLGIPVEDAKARVLVTVTDQDVVLSKKKDSKHCALARAALRLPEVNAAYFFRTKAFIEYGDRVLRFALPSSVQKEIVSFDRAQVMASGIYQLTPPPPSDKPSRKKSSRKQRLDKERRRAKSTSRNVIESPRAELIRAIEKVAATATPNHTPEQLEFDNRVATLMNRNAGTRTVSGMPKAGAPEPLAQISPKRGYVHRTQYVRDLREP